MQINLVFLSATFLFAYLATLVANTVRISTALQLKQTPLQISWLNQNQLHRFEGILIYFGFLLLLLVVSERYISGSGAGSAVGPSLRDGGTGQFWSLASWNSFRLLRQLIFPLLIYYATTIGVPFANGAYRQSVDFWEHSLFVLLTPLLLTLPLAAFAFAGRRRSRNFK